MAIGTKRLSGPRRRFGLARAAVGLLCATTMAAVPLALAQSEAPSTEQKVKAAFLYKFAAYVEWPARVFPRPDSPIVIGVAGSHALADELAYLVRDRLVDGRRIEVQRISGSNALSGVHVLFAGAAERPAEVLSAVRGRPILTVSESDDASGAGGGVINLVVAEDRVRFDVSLRAAEANNLKISSRLLGVARKIVGGPS